jgi:putative PEP-CTERM system TPR-repeat lipoprotein
MQPRLRRLMACAVLLVAIGAACSNPQAAKLKYLESGNSYLQQKKYPEAIVEYRNAVNIDPNFGAARRQLAEAYDLSGDAANAYREYVRAADLLPDDLEVQIKTGLFLLVGGRFDDAKARAQKALAKDPKSVDGLILMGMATAGLKDKSGAIDQIEQALQIDPSRASTYLGLAQVQLAGGDRTRAEAALKSAVSVDPKSIDAALVLANFYLSTGRTAEAAHWFQTAVAINPKDSKANRALGSYFMASGRAREAEAPLKVAAESGDAAPSLVLADYYYQMGRTAEAKTLVESLRNDPKVFAETRIRLAILAYSEKRPADAYRLIDDILAREPKQAVALVLKGRFLLTDHRTDDAVPPLEAGASAAPQFAGAQYWLGTAYRLQNKLDEAAACFGRALELRPGDPGSLAQLSDVKLRQGKKDAALSLARDAVASSPGYLQGHVALVKALLATGDRRAYEAEGALIAKQFPKELDAQVILGLIAMGRRDSAAAAQAFQRALDIDPDSTDAISGLVAAYIADNKVDKAKALLDAKLAKRPSDGKLLQLASEIYAVRSDDLKREEMLRKSIAADPSNLQAYLDLSHLLMARGNTEESRRQYDAMLAKDPKNVPVMTLTALMLQIENKRAEAIQRYERVLQIDPNAGIAANNLAMLYGEDGKNLDTALKLAQVAVRQLPDAPESNDTLGWICYLKGLHALAVPAFQISVRKDPNNPIYHYHLGLAYAKLGEKAKARASLEQALKLKGDFDGAAEARRLLGTM